MYIFISDHNRNQFSKDILSKDSQFTHIPALKSYTNTLSQSHCKARPHPTTMMMSQNVTLPVFTTTASKMLYTKG
jgi:hypothetical protein